MKIKRNLIGTLLLSILFLLLSLKVSNAQVVIEPSGSSGSSVGGGFPVEYSSQYDGTWDGYPTIFNTNIGTGAFGILNIGTATELDGYSGLRVYTGLEEVLIGLDDTRTEVLSSGSVIIERLGDTNATLFSFNISEDSDTNDLTVANGFVNGYNISKQFVEVSADHDDEGNSYDYGLSVPETGADNQYDLVLYWNVDETSQTPIMRVDHTNGSTHFGYNISSTFMQTNDGQITGSGNPAYGFVNSPTAGISYTNASSEDGIVIKTASHSTAYFGEHQIRWADNVIVGFSGSDNTTSDTVKAGMDRPSNGTIHFNTGDVDTTGTIIFKLPTTDPAEAGVIWNNSGVVSVSTGL